MVVLMMNMTRNCLVSGFAAQATLQRVCSGFLACVDQFRATIPASFADGALIEINKSFLVVCHGNFLIFTAVLNLKPFPLRWLMDFQNWV